MKRVLLILATCSLSVSTITCHSGEKPMAAFETIQADSNSNKNKENMSKNILITVGNASFTATLEDNEAGNAFAALLPMTITMSEMNGNEKYYYLSSDLPTEGYRPGTIRNGDLMLYGSNCVVLFYETFTSSYSYTRLGKVTNPERLAATLGRGSVTVTFEVSNN